MLLKYAQIFPPLPSLACDCYAVKMMMMHILPLHHVEDRFDLNTVVDKTQTVLQQHICNAKTVTGSLE